MVGESERSTAYFGICVSRRINASGLDPTGSESQKVARHFQQQYERRAVSPPKPYRPLSLNPKP